LSLAAWKLGIAFAACAVLVGERWIRRPRIVTAALAVIASLGLAAYFEWGRFPRGYVHHWDMYHYYMGSKYFDEVGYDGLYDATAVAMLDSPDFQARGTLRPDDRIRNLATNELGTAAEAYQRGLQVKARFTPERWETFHLELAFWGPDRVFWIPVLEDHGYNPSPVAHRFYSLITGRMYERDPDRMLVLALVDPVLLVLSFALIAWAFGVRTMLLSAIAFSVSFASPFSWTGGAFIRQDWLFFVVAGVCTWRRNRPALAGAALAAAALERVFPALFAIGIAVAIARALWLRRRPSPSHLRFVAGAAIATVLLVGASFTTAWGAGIWPRFATRISHHASVPATNNVGARIAVTYHIGDNSRAALRRSKAEGAQASELWRTGRHEVYTDWRWLTLALGALFLVGYVAAAWRVDEVTAMVLAATLVTGLLMTGSYYYTFVMLLPVLVRPDRPALGVAMLMLISYPYLLIGSDDWTFYHCSIGWTLLSILLLVAARKGWTRVHDTSAS
jgi:hypothetical protein